MNSILNNNTIPRWIDDYHRSLSESDTADEKADVFTFFGLSMVVFTLCLLLALDFLRYKLDSNAKNTFYASVLQCVYGELATLGILNSIIFLLIRFTPDLVSGNTFHVFEYVHMLIFYVAILNAIKTMMLFRLAVRWANSHWKKVEELDIDHYVAIRQEFNIIDEQLQAEKTKKKNFPDFFLKIMNYALTIKHRRLLVQVLFHEMRVNFLEMNNLPPKFKISSYLKTGLDRDFEKFVEISSVTWTWTMISFQAYDICALSLHQVTYIEVRTVVPIFICIYSVALVLLSIAIHRKMWNIFHEILNRWERSKNQNNNNEQNGNVNKVQNQVRTWSASVVYVGSVQTLEEVKQFELFPLKDPRYVLWIAQIVQIAFAIPFGYMLAVNNLPVSPALCFIPLYCYIICLIIWSRIIPHYTLCTSIGDLVNKARLAESYGRFTLAEEKKKRLKAKEELAKQIITETSPRFETLNTNPLGRVESSKELEMISDLTKRDVKELPVIPEYLGITPKRRSRRSLSDGVEAMILPCSITESAQDLLNEVGENNPQLIEKESNEARSSVLKKRRARRKSISAGIDIMRSGHKLQSSNTNISKDDCFDERTTRSFKASMFTSHIIDERSKCKERELEMVSRLTKLDVKELPEIPKYSEATSKRRNRRSLSDGVAAMILPRSISGPASALLSEIGESKSSRSTETIVRHPRMKTVSAGIDAMRSGPNLQPADSNFLKDDSFSARRLRAFNARMFTSHIIHERFKCEDEITDDGSNCDDLPEITESSYENEREHVSISIGRKIWSFLKNQIDDFVEYHFSTIIILFLSGIRIERIYYLTCRFGNQLSYKMIEPNVCFVLETTLLSGIILYSICVLTLQARTKNNTYIAINRSIDLFLCSMFICLLFWAEAERCCSCGDTNCHCSNSRLLGSSTQDNETRSCVDSPECCPKFGSRLCGGVGNIEPFTALFVLRYFRKFISMKIYSYFNSTFQDIEHSKFSFQVQSKGNIPLDTDVEIKIFDKDHNGTILQLWQYALYHFPHIVEKHGRFSGELLEAMLCISEPLATSELPVNISTKEVKHDQIFGTSEQNNQNDSQLLNQSSLNQMGSPLFRIESGTIAESPSYSRSLEESGMDNFRNPDAPLIRSIRRCQYKFPPLMPEWKVADLLLTKYEIVILDVNKSAEEESMFNKTLQNQIVSTQGGKRLRLRDACLTHGGMLLGHLNLKDIDNIFVRRRYPTTSHQPRVNNIDIDEEYCADEGDFLNEYWERPEASAIEPVKGPCQSQWNNVIEDRLSLRNSKEGTLFFRFYSDLMQEKKCHMLVTENKVNAKFERKHGALLWCQTILHICGKDQLKQYLPNLGNDRDAELNDVVHVVERFIGDDGFASRSMLRTSLLMPFKLHH